MKNLIIIILMTLFCFEAGLNAQIKTKEKRIKTDSAGVTSAEEVTVISTSEDITPRNQMIVINPLKFFLFYNITYFHRVDRNLAVGGGIQIPTLEGITGFGINAEMRFYPSGKTLRGFYLAPNISYNELTADHSTVRPLSFGILCGWQWFPGDDFAIGLGIGIDYYSGAGSDNSTGLNDYHGSVPAVRFDIGYAW